MAFPITVKSHSIYKKNLFLSFIHQKVCVGIYGREGIYLLIHGQIDDPILTSILWFRMEKNNLFRKNSLWNRQ